MSTTANDGGPAFPVPYMNGELRGMSLRDYFAASALQGMLASGERGGAKLNAQDAYEQADAMLRAREVKSDG